MFVAWEHLELLLDSVDNGNVQAENCVCSALHINMAPWEPTGQLILYHNVAGIFSEGFNLVNWQIFENHKI